MNEHVCPVWVGYFLLGPVRKFFTNPDRILKKYVRPGMSVLEPGPAMGFFSLPLARLVGESGRVVSVDLQEEMIARLKRRAARAGLAGRMDFRVCREDSLGVDDLAGTIDFALAMYVVHEVPDSRRFFLEIFQSLKKGGTFLVAEPVGHVTKEEFAGTISLARAVGFELRETPEIRRTYSAYFARP